MFTDRREAGRALARALARLRDEDPVVLALPRGGVTVGDEVARALDAPLDVLVVRKLGAPGQPELAMGAVVDGDRPQEVLNEEIVELLGVSPAELAHAVRHELGEIARRHRLYRGERLPEPITGRTVIVVDDGIATGATVRAALRALRRARPRRLVLAVPVAPADTVAALRPEVDTLVCLDSPEPFIAVGAHYRDFDQVRDEEVVAALEAARRRRPACRPA